MLTFSPDPRTRQERQRLALKEPDRLLVKYNLIPWFEDQLRKLDSDPIHTPPQNIPATALTT